MYIPGMLGKNFSKLCFGIFFLFCSENRVSHFVQMQIVSGYIIHAITSVGQSVRSEKNLSEISKNSVRFFLGAVFCHTK